MRDLIKLTRVESRAKEAIEWGLPDKVMFTCFPTSGEFRTVYHNVLIQIAEEKKHWWNSGWKMKSFFNKDCVMVIAKGLDYLEEYGYALDTSELSSAEKIMLGLAEQTDREDEENANRG